MEDRTASRIADSDYVPFEEFLAVTERLAKEEKLRRINRFRSGYTYTSDSSNNIERKTCIWSGGKCSWQDQSSGIVWVVVHGTNTICAVTRRKLDKKRVGGSFSKARRTNTILYGFMETLICEIENGSFPKSDQSITKPFGIVSMIPDTNKASSADYDESASINLLTEKMKTGLAFTSDDTAQVSDTEYDENAAIDFLTEKMKTDSAFTLDDTIQTAISSLQHLCRKKFKARQILGCVLKEKRTYVSGLPSNQIKNHLAVINECPWLPLPIPSTLGFTRETKRSRGVEDEEAAAAAAKLFLRSNKNKLSGSGGGDSTTITEAIFLHKRMRTNRNKLSGSGGGGGSTTISEVLSKLTIA